jgi:hypothetical protein
MRSGTAWLVPALLALAGACSTREREPAASLTVVETLPMGGERIQADTVLKIVADYDLGRLEPGRDRIVVAFRNRDGDPWEAGRALLTASSGRVTLEVPGAKLLNEPSLAHPLEMLLTLERWSASGSRTLSSVNLAHFGLPGKPMGPEVAPKFVPPNIGRSLIRDDYQRDPRFAPTVPARLGAAGTRFWGLFKVCVDTQGEVYDVQVLRRADPQLDSRWQATLRRWKYRPYEIDGKPVPFCYPLRLDVAAAE